MSWDLGVLEMGQVAAHARHVTGKSPGVGCESTPAGYLLKMDHFQSVVNMLWTFRVRLCIVTIVARGLDGASETGRRKTMERDFHLRYLVSPQFGCGLAGSAFRGSSVGNGLRS